MNWLQRRSVADSAVPPVNPNARPRNVVRHFRDFLEQHPITVVDVGARGGVPGELGPLCRHLRLVSVEPDPAEADRLAERFQSLGLRSALVLPHALGPHDQESLLRVTRDPGRSSLLEPNASVVGRYGEADEYEVVARRPLKTVALGRLLIDHDLNTIDLVKLDVQGFEMEVLKTLAPQHWDGLLFLETEVEFVELYRGQPLFRHVDEYISARGFEIFNLSRVFTNYGGGRGVPYGKGQLQFADAYYLRTQLDSLTGLQIAKLIFLAAYYGFNDYAYFLFHRHEARVDASCRDHVHLFRQFLISYSRSSGTLRPALSDYARRAMNKLLFFYLTWRRWNGRDGDNDRYYPIR